MTNSINPRILKTIREKSGDKTVEKCLEELLFFEAENPAWYKDKYKEKIEKYVDEWGDKK